MSNQSNNDSEHEEIVSMLPWFVNQSLDDGRRTIVSNHIEHCEKCQHEVRFLSLLNETVNNDAQSKYDAHADVEKGLKSVMSRIDAEEHQHQRRALLPSLPRQVIDSLSEFVRSMSVPQWSATAMVGLLVAVLGFQNFYSQPENDYSVLSASEVDSSSMQLSVIPASADNWDQTRSVIQDEFDKLDKPVAFKMTTNGEYIIVLEDSMDVTELGQIMVDLESMELIQRVELLP